MFRPNIKISLLSSIFICLSAVFLMSHNVGALNNQLLGDDWYLYRHTSGNPMCAMNSFDPAARRQSVDSPWNVFNGQYNYFSCADSNNSAISAQHGDIIVVELNTDYELSPYWYNTSARYLFSAFSKSIQTIYYYTDGFNSSVEFGWIYNSEINGVNNVLFRIQSINFYRKNSSPPSYEAALNSIQNSLGTVNNNLNNINNSINDLPSAEDNAAAIADEQEQRTQDVVDDSQDTADSSQEDTDETGTSLLSVFTSVIGVIVNSQETSCTFDSHLPFMSGTGTIDLCMFNPPAVVQTIASLLALALFVPFGLHMYKRFISITRSFQK